jgi:lipoate-protein ligase A
MYLIYNDSTDPAFNLALEEYVLTQLTGEFILLWRNARAVIIGRNQNAVEEVDMDYAREKNISVNRRISGGGAVFHDLGNINYTVIKDQGEDDFGGYAEFTGPVIAFLKELGVEAQLSGRNDLTVKGMKISGNAQASRNGRIMHHGTLLYDVSVGDLAGVLRPNQAKISSKGIKSVRSRVTNLVEHLPEKMDPLEFLQQLYDFYLRSRPDVVERRLTAEEIAAVQKLVKEKFATWEWNFGHSPAYDLQKNQRFDFGMVDVRLSVSGGVMKEVKIFGDFFGMEEITELERRLTGVLHRREAIAEALAKVDLGRYIHGISLEQLLSLF